VIFQFGSPKRTAKFLEGVQHPLTCIVQIRVMVGFSYLVLFRTSMMVDRVKHRTPPLACHPKVDG
jgi:hypothetical protein